MGEETKISLDFEPGTAGSPSTVPPGAYLASVEEITPANSPKAGNYLKVRLNIEDEEVVDPETGDAVEVQGRKLFDNWFSGKKSGFKLDGFMEAIGYTTEETDEEGKPVVDFSDFLEQTVGVTVVLKPILDDDKNETGKFRNEVTKYIDSSKL